MLDKTRRNVRIVRLCLSSFRDTKRSIDCDNKMAVDKIVKCKEGARANDDSKVPDANRDLCSRSLLDFEK